MNQFYMVAYGVCLEGVRGNRRALEVRWSIGVDIGVRLEVDVVYSFGKVEARSVFLCTLMMDLQLGHLT